MRGQLLREEVERRETAVVGNVQETLRSQRRIVGRAWYAFWVW